MSRRYRWLTLLVSVCRDHGSDDLLFESLGNIFRMLDAVVDEDGKAVVEARVILGKNTEIDNYSYPITKNGETMFRNCVVLRKLYARLPREMSREEITEYLGELTGIKPPINNDKQYRELLAKLYEELIGEW